MAATVTLATTYVPLGCSCGATYALSATFIREAKQRGTGWTCPHCKTGRWFGEGENDRLREQLETQERRTASETRRADRHRRQAEINERRRRAEKGAKTRLKNRIGRGVCPCCNRTFENLARHMAGQHPEFVAEADADEPVAAGN